MKRFAEKTRVDSHRSKSEIERVLKRYGATEFAYVSSSDKAMVAFRLHERHVRFLIPMPSPTEREFTHTEKRGSKRATDATFKAWEQACNQRWRALALVIKAKLEAVQSGITCFEDEFLAHIVLPNGETVGDWMKPQIAESYKHNTVPKTLPFFGVTQ